LKTYLKIFLKNLFFGKKQLISRLVGVFSQKHMNPSTLAVLLT